MQQENSIPVIPQYSLGKILLIWVAAAIPMGALGWIVAPALSVGSANPGVIRLAALTVGLIWQFVLVLILLRREGSTLRWADIRQRLWLLPPSNNAGRTDRRLWWWLVPLILVAAVYAIMVSGVIEDLWVGLLPFFAEPPSFSMSGFLDSPESQAAMVGNWGLFLLFVVQMLFNTVLGEELLWRGLLLPRMAGAFGKWDWLANGILFGLYHWHQPWGMLGSAIDGALLYAWPSRRFKSAWFGIIIHSGQSVFFAFLLLGLVLGLA
jgi:membrane protease YdiL (CAAX protease family)